MNDVDKVIQAKKLGENRRRIAFSNPQTLCTHQNNSIYCFTLCGFGGLCGFFGHFELFYYFLIDLEHFIKEACQASEVRTFCRTIRLPRDGVIGLYS